MSRPWDSLNEAATIAQLSGMDAIALISMILQLVKTFHSNDEEYMQLEQRVRACTMILREADMLMQHQAIMLGLQHTLRKAYMLVRSFRDSSVTYRFFMGWKQAGHLRKVQKKIDMYLQLYHVGTDVDNNRLLHLIADRIQGTSAIAAVANTATTVATVASVHLDTPSEGSDVDGDIVGIASPQPDPQQPDLAS